MYEFSDRIELKVLFKGYYNAEKKTSEKIVSDMIDPGDSWFNTGDAFTFDEEYRLRFMDRIRASSCIF